MRLLVISAITQRLVRSPNPRSLPALICGESVPHSFQGGYLDIPLYRPLHSLGFRDIYSNGIFFGLNNLYEESRACEIGFFRVLSTEAVVTKEAAEEDEDPSKGLPDSLYRRISRAGYPKRSVVAELERWILEGREIEKDDLKQIVKGLRKYNRPKEALEDSGARRLVMGCRQPH